MDETTRGAAQACPRDAATLILIRRDGPAPRVLMGQRGAGAVFMPMKFVFPGGALDPCDRSFPGDTPLSAPCAARLAVQAEPGIGPALARAAIRETFEEAGLAFGRPDPAAPALAAGEGWRGFLARGLMPDTGALRFVFRAITPPGRSRRFDARFFLADAAGLADDPDDLSRASGELSHLTWLDFEAALALEMPFITEVVLGEVAEILTGGAGGRPVPFFDHAEERSHFRAL